MAEVGGREMAEASSATTNHGDSAERVLRRKIMNCTRSEPQELDCRYDPLSVNCSEMGSYRFF